MLSRKRRRSFWAAGGLVVALVAALSAKLFVWPAQDPLEGAHADAIVVLGGPGPRLRVALQLAKEHAAPVMLISVPSVRWRCPRVAVPGVRVQCFRPDPFSTQGEARYAAEQARLHHWDSLIVVSSVPQATRARLRIKRCFGGTVKVVAARPSLAGWAYGVVYEWGALAKALVWQRSC
ncbi:MAG: YdcF family protein [Acidimicrobiales bacterium]